MMLLNQKESEYKSMGRASLRTQSVSSLRGQMSESAEICSSQMSY